MNTEIEAKFLNIDIDQTRAKLEKIGAKCTQPMRQMKRAIIDYPDKKLQNQSEIKAYIRVREEGDKTTLTYKQFDKSIKLHIASAKEIETIVESFDDTVKIFEAIGLKVHSLQESKRETWEINDVEVVIDIWPWLNPYIEIEGEDESRIKKIAEQLGFEWQDAVFGDVMIAYREQYPNLPSDFSIGNLPKVRFIDPIPEKLK